MLIRQSFLYLGSRAVTGAVTFFVLTLYTRLLTPSEYGFYTLVIATEMLAFTLSFLAVCSATLRLAAAARDQAEFHSGIALVYLAMVLLLAAIFGVASQLVPGTDTSIFRWTLALLVAHGWLEINLHLQTARLKAGRYILACGARSLITAGTGLWLIWMGYGVEGAIGGTLAGLVVPAIWLTFAEWRGLSLRRPSTRTMREILAFGAPLSLGYALDSVVYYSDRLVIAAVGGTDAVGRYAAGFDLADKSLSAIMTAIGTAGFSIALRTFERGDRQGLARQLERNVTLLLAIGLPATVGLVLVAPDLALLLGAEFRGAARTIIPIIAVTIFFGCLRGNYFDHSFHLSRKTLWLTFIVAVTAVGNILLNIALVTRWGVNGTAFATLAAYSLSLLMSIVIGRRVFKLPFPFREALKIVLASATMALVVLNLPAVQPPFSLILRVLAGAVSYGACALFLNVLGLRIRFSKAIRLRMRVLLAAR